MVEVKQILTRIAAEAEQRRPQGRLVRKIAPGEVVRQGDVYLYALAAAPEKLGEPVDSRQLAPGTSPGSRHVVVGPARVYPRHRFSEPDPEGGPYVEAKKRVVVRHPEHAAISLPAGWYEVRYQVDYSDVADEPHAEGAKPPTWEELRPQTRRVVD